MTISPFTNPTPKLLVFAISLFFLAFPENDALAQDDLVFRGQMWQDAKAVFLVQGEKRKLAEDFVVQLDGDALHISLEARGLVNTRPSDDLLVTLIQPSGERMDERPDEEGNLLFSGVQEGLAAIIVTADALADTSVSSLYAAIPLFVSPPDDNAVATDPVKIPMALVEPGALVARLNDEVEEISDDAEVMQSDEFEIVKFGQFRVQRLADGSVQGQVVVPQRGYLAMPGPTQITFQKDGLPLVSTTSKDDGTFVAESVPVGVNSIVATGRAGHAAYSIEVVEFAGGEDLLNPVTDRGQQHTRYVAKMQPAGDSLLVALIPPALMDEYRDVADERLPAPVIENVQPLADITPMSPAGGAPGPASGGFAASGSPVSSFGGSGFGGGGGGGFVGGGAGAGLAGLAAIAAASAISDDDDGFNINLASPISATGPAAAPVVPPQPAIPAEES